MSGSERFRVVSGQPVARVYCTPSFEGAAVNFEPFFPDYSAALRRLGLTQGRCLQCAATFESATFCDRYGELSRQFVEVQAAWEKLVLYCGKFSAVRAFCVDDDCLQALEVCEELVGCLVSGIDHLLDTSRDAFPLFHLLPDTKLIQLLSSPLRSLTSDRMPALSCLFDFESMVFDDNQRRPLCIGVRGRDGAICFFKEPIPYRDNIPQLFIAVRDALRHTLSSAIRTAVLTTHVLKGAMSDVVSPRHALLPRHLLLYNPPQVAEVILRLRFTRAVEDAVVHGLPLSTVLRQEEAILKGLSDIVRGIPDGLVVLPAPHRAAPVTKSPLGLRSTLREHTPNTVSAASQREADRERRVAQRLLQVQLGHCEVIALLMERGLDAVTDPVWTQQIRFYWSDVRETVLVNVGGVDMEYGYTFHDWAEDDPPAFPQLQLAAPAFRAFHTPSLITLVASGVNSLPAARSCVREVARVTGRRCHVRHWLHDGERAAEAVIVLRQLLGAFASGSWFLLEAAHQCSAVLRTLVANAFDEYAKGVTRQASAGDATVSANADGVALRVSPVVPTVVFASYADTGEGGLPHVMFPTRKCSRIMYRPPHPSVVIPPLLAAIGGFSVPAARVAATKIGEVASFVAQQPGDDRARDVDSGDWGDSVPWRGRMYAGDDLNVWQWVCCVALHCYTTLGQCTLLMEEEAIALGLHSVILPRLGDANGAAFLNVIHQQFPLVDFAWLYTVFLRDLRAGLLAHVKQRALQFTSLPEIWRPDPAEETRPGTTGSSASPDHRASREGSVVAPPSSLPAARKRPPAPQDTFVVRLQGMLLALTAAKECGGRPLDGRDRILQKNVRSWWAALPGTPHLVVVGEEGAGKTSTIHLLRDTVMYGKTVHIPTAASAPLPAEKIPLLTAKKPAAPTPACNDNVRLRLDPDASYTDIIGSLDPATLVWTDGDLTRAIRKGQAASSGPQEATVPPGADRGFWILLSGLPPPWCVDLFAQMLGNPRHLILPSKEALVLPPSIHFVWELTPAALKKWPATLTAHCLVMRVPKQTIRGERLLERQARPLCLQTDVSGVVVSDQDLRDEFERYDVDGKGWISKEDFRQMYRRMDHYGLEDRLIPKVDEILARHNMLDDDKLSDTEFAVLMLQLAQR